MNRIASFANQVVVSTHGFRFILAAIAVFSTSPRFPESTATVLCERTARVVQPNLVKSRPGTAVSEATFSPLVPQESHVFFWLSRGDVSQISVAGIPKLRVE